MPTRRTLRKVRDLTVADSTVVLNAVKRHVMQRATEPDPDRDETVLHPSEMCKGDWCERRDFYRIVKAPFDPKANSPSFGLESIWEEGHGIHRKWQGWLHEMGVLYGVWECRDCRERWWDTSPMDCPLCGSDKRPWYREIPLYAPELNVVGHADGGLLIGDAPMRLVEIKSIGLNSLRFDAPDLWERYQNNETMDHIWRDVKRPFAPHLRQGMLYLYLINRGRDGIYCPEIVFIYEFKPNQQVKEFVVKYNPRLVERMIAGAERVTESLETGRAPKRPQWAVDEDHKICLGCGFRTHCWKLDDAGNQDHAPPTPIKRGKASVRRRYFAPSPLRGST